MRKDLELKAQAEAEDSALITIEEVEEEPEEQKRGGCCSANKNVPTNICMFLFFGQARMKMGRTLAFFFALSTFFQVHKHFYEFFFHK